MFGGELRWICGGFEVIPLIYGVIPGGLGVIWPFLGVDFWCHFSCFRVISDFGAILGVLLSHGVVWGILGVILVFAGAISGISGLSLSILGAILLVWGMILGCFGVILGVLECVWGNSGLVWFVSGLVCSVSWWV